MSIPSSSGTCDEIMPIEDTNHTFSSNNPTQIAISRNVNNRIEPTSKDDDDNNNNRSSMAEMLSKLIIANLNSLDKISKKIRKYEDRIKDMFEEFNKLEQEGGTEHQFGELKRNIIKLKQLISANHEDDREESDPHRRQSSNKGTTPNSKAAPVRVYNQLGFKKQTKKRKKSLIHKDDSGSEKDLFLYKSEANWSFEDVMEETDNSERLNKEAPRLSAVLKEMKEGLDMLRSKVQALTAKVREDHFPTADGISYLEAKHLLLLNYCQSLVYYLLRKAKGLSIEGHPVVRSLVEIRLFLEKVRPIDKKLQYQIQKLTKVTAGAVDKVGSSEKEEDVTQKTEDLLKYRPNPDMLVSKTNTSHEDGGGVYRPPKFAPTSMEEDKVSKQERNAMRKDKAVLREARQSAYVRELMDDLEGRPEEVREIVGTESREVIRYRAKMEERARREEELFTRAPLTKVEKNKMKHLKKSRNGLLGLTDSFYDEIKSLPLEDNVGEQMTGFGNDNSGERRPMKQRRRKH